MKNRLFVLFLTGLFLSSTAFCGEAQADSLHKLSIQQLMDMEITSVSRSAKPLSQSAAAVTVITQEDIRRSGATNVAELLRFVPGMQVARVTSSQWAISARGFNGTVANKLQVLVDGRSVYTPLFSGVYWDVQDLMLEDVERIEVIRGPGASVWGANAVNGVISITTKKAKDTQGNLLTLGAGDEERAFGNYRYGGRHGETDHYRVYGKFFDRDDLQNGNDSWRQARGGLRIDRQADSENSYTVQSDHYNGENDVRYTGNRLTAPFTTTVLEDEYVAGGNVLWRWNHVEDASRDSQLQFYYDNTLRDRLSFEEERHAFDIDWKKRMPWGESHHVTWGLGYRLMADDTAGNITTAFVPADEIDQLFSTFVQDEILLMDDALWLTLGSKFEHNDYTGYEVQPSARLSWKVSPRQTVWTSVSRAVRAPSRLDHHLRIQGWLDPGVALGQALGDADVQSEELTAYEAGYRVQPTPELALDLAVFANHYDRLTMWRPGESFTDGGFTVTPYHADDQMEGQSHGLEISAQYQALPHWRLYSGYTFLTASLNGGNDGLNSESTAEGSSPKNQLFVRSHYDWNKYVEVNSGVRYVDNLERLDTGSYVELDLNLVWHVSEDTDIALVGQNLIEEHHAEFASAGSTTASRTQRSVFAKVTKRF